MKKIISLRCLLVLAVFAAITVNAIAQNNVKVITNSDSSLTFKVGDAVFKMMPVKGGTFMMGATKEQADEATDDEYPVHSETVGDFYMGETEVTKQLWHTVMGTLVRCNWTEYNKPIGSVRYIDCEEFIKQLNELTGRTLRLPTEAEWEYAARGGDKTHGYMYAGSNNIDEVAWYLYNTNEEIKEVAQKKPNELGLYDMSGNVFEWCSGWYAGYTDGKTTHKIKLNAKEYHVYRGGSSREAAHFCRVSNRDFYAPLGSFPALGLRLVLEP